MNRSDYNAEMVAQFRSQVLEHIVPLASKLVERQRERIGLDSMKYYDLPFQFVTGNPTPKGTSEWIVEQGRHMYSELSSETKEFFDYMLDRESLDLLSKKGKDTGGYCTYLSHFQLPYIFANFNGTSGDIDVLTHEAGHAFQVYESRGYQVPEYHFPTSEACEIHSMSMEFLTWPCPSVITTKCLIWKRAEENRTQAWTDNLALCREGGSKSFTELIAVAKLDSPFEAGGIQSVMKDVERWLDQIDDKAL